MAYRYRLTVGEYEDLIELGTFGTRYGAEHALGRHVIERAEQAEGGMYARVYVRHPVEYPRIETIGVEDSEDEGPSEEEVRQFAAFISFARDTEADESEDRTAERLGELLVNDLEMDKDEVLALLNGLDALRA